MDKVQKHNSFKSKSVPVLFFLTEHHMKAYLGSGCIAPRVIDFGTRWSCVVSFTARPLYTQGESPDTHCKIFWLGNLKGRDRLEDLGASGKKILK
jgi:hypothetical protein